MYECSFFINKWTLINNQFISDPGGSMPAWVVNSFLASNPYNTVKELKENDFVLI